MHISKIDVFKKLCGHPERIVWAVAQANGKRSICPLGAQMGASFKPPIIAICVSPRNFTHGLITASGEFVLSWPGESLAEATLFCGTKSGRDVDKFAETDITTRPGRYVKAPIIEQSIANLECRLAGQINSGDHTVFLGEIICVWTNKHPQKQLCLVGNEKGCRVLVKKGIYKIGVIK
ncbi:MAG: flavin reductase family protein [Candidatus Omnitrophica bacterium]|nr:flavin reductase family protein [Candidatus Omnitrophota bacterium]